MAVHVSNECAFSIHPTLFPELLNVHLIIADDGISCLHPPAKTDNRMRVDNTCTNWLETVCALMIYLQTKYQTELLQPPPGARDHG